MGLALSPSSLRGTKCRTRLRQTPARTLRPAPVPSPRASVGKGKGRAQRESASSSAPCFSLLSRNSLHTLCASHAAHALTLPSPFARLSLPSSARAPASFFPSALPRVARPLSVLSLRRCRRWRAASGAAAAGTGGGRPLCRGRRQGQCCCRSGPPRQGQSSRSVGRALPCSVFAERGAPAMAARLPRCGRPSDEKGSGSWRSVDASLLFMLLCGDQLVAPPLPCLLHSCPHPCCAHARQPRSWARPWTRSCARQGSSWHSARQTTRQMRQRLLQPLQKRFEVRRASKENRATQRAAARQFL